LTALIVIIKALRVFYYFLHLGAIAKVGIACICGLSVCLSLCLSICLYVCPTYETLWSYKLDYFASFYLNNSPFMFTIYGHIFTNLVQGEHSGVFVSMMNL